MSQSNKRPIALTAAVVLLVLAAGCAGSLSGGDGYDVAGSELDGETLTNQTATEVESSGSYSLNSTQALIRERQGETLTEQTDEEWRINFESDTGIRSTEETQSVTASTQSASVVVYTDGNVSYGKRNTSTGVSYGVQEDGGTEGTAFVNTTTFQQNYTGFVDNFGWERNGTETVDGTTVTNYTAVQNGTSDGLGNVSGQMLVDGDGVIRELTLNYTLTGYESEPRVEISIVLEDIGSTTVEEPDWISDAQEQSS